MEPKELLVPLQVGAVAIGAGIGGLWRSRKYKKNPFTKPAKLLLSKQTTVGVGQIQVLFLEHEMQVQPADGNSVVVPYSEFEFVIETADIFLLTYRDCATLLQKRDLVTEYTADFCDFIASKVEFIRVDTSKPPC